MTPVITRKLEIDAGHRLLNHEGKCRHVHGHRYVVEVSCSAPGLDQVGRVIDFSVVKSVVGGWLDTHWDHGFVAQTGDPIIDWLDAQKMKVYELGDPPTAENMSKYLFEKAKSLLEPHGVAVVKIRIYETPNCWSDYPEVRP